MSRLWRQWRPASIFGRPRAGSTTPTAPCSTRASTTCEHHRPIAQTPRGGERERQREGEGQSCERELRSLDDAPTRTSSPAKKTTSPTSHTPSTSLPSLHTGSTSTCPAAASGGGACAGDTPCRTTSSGGATSPRRCCRRRGPSTRTAASPAARRSTSAACRSSCTRG